jgi:hypothetical protein
LILAQHDRVGKALADNLILRRRILLAHRLIIQIDLFPGNAIFALTRQNAVD